MNFICVIAVKKKHLTQWLENLPVALREKLINHTDPARVFSLLSFDKSVKSLGKQHLKAAQRIAVVSGGLEEPELAFLGVDAEKVDLLRFEEDPDLWDLCKDWSGEKYINFRGEYDVVLCEQVLEHVPEPSLAFANLCKLLKPQGVLHVSVPGVNGVHGEPYYYFAGFHPRLLALWAEREDLSVIDCSSWGCQKAARMYACCDWAPLAISGGLALQLRFFFERLNLSKVKRLLLHLFRYPFQSLWAGSGRIGSEYPVIVWLLAVR